MNVKKEARAIVKVANTMTWLRETSEAMIRRRPYAKNRAKAVKRLKSIRAYVPKKHLASFDDHVLMLERSDCVTTCRMRMKGCASFLRKVM